MILVWKISEQNVQTAQLEVIVSATMHLPGNTQQQHETRACYAVTMEFVISADEEKLYFQMN